MARSTLTSQASDNIWKVNLFTHKLPDDSLEVVFPSGFKANIYGVKNVPTVMAYLTRWGQDLELWDGIRLHIGEAGEMWIKDCDPWYNEGFNYGDRIGTAYGMAAILSEFVKERL